MSSRPRTPSTVPAAPLALGTLLLGCTLLPLAGGAHAAALRIGVGTRAASAPLLVAEERGYFEREEVEVTLEPLDVDTDLIESLAEEELDLAAAGAQLLLLAEDGGLELRGAYVLGIGGEGDAIVARGDVGDTRGLIGRRVAVLPDTAGELLLRQELQLKGRRLSDVERVPLAPDEAVRALLAGEVDAAALAEPALSTPALVASLDAGESRVIADAVRPAGLVSDLLVGIEGTLDRSKEELKGIVRAVDRAVAWMRRNPEAAAGIVAERLGIEPARAAHALDGVELLGVEDNMQLLRGEFQKAFSAMSGVLDADDSGRPRETPSANSYLSLSALRQVAAGR